MTSYFNPHNFSRFVAIAAVIIVGLVFFLKNENSKTLHEKLSADKLKGASEETKPSIVPITDEEKKNLALLLKRHALELMATQRSLTFSALHFHKLGQHVQTVNEILKALQQSELRNNNSFSIGKPSSKDIPQKQEVCPEKYLGKNLNTDYPFWRKGFGRVNCTDFVPMHKLITILISIPEQLSKPAGTYVEILEGVAKYHPKTRVILATEKVIDESTKSSISKLDIDFKNEPINGINQGNLWHKLVEQVQTPYVLIAPHITHFNDDINLERLVRILSNNKDVVIAGGSYRNFKGEWDIGCQQVSFRNWTASYMGGYYYSFNECVVCDFVAGPWMAKTQALKELDFDLK